MGNSLAKQRRRSQNRRQGDLVLRVFVGSFIIVLVAIVTAILFSQNAEISRIKSKHQELVAERDRLAIVNADLEQLQSMMDTNEYWESVARSQLGMVRPHEIVINIED